MNLRFTEFLEQISNGISKVYSSERLMLVNLNAHLVQRVINACNYNLFIISRNTPSLMEINNISYDFKMRQVIPVMPYGEIMFNSQKHCRDYIIIVVIADYLQSIAKKTTGKEFFSLPTNTSSLKGELSMLIRDYRDESSKGEQQNCINMNYLEELLVSYLVKAYCRLPDVKICEIDYEEYINKAICYIDKHYYEPIDIFDICLAINIGKQELEKHFKRTQHISLSKYMEKLRCEKAKSLLIKNDKSFEQVSQACGFRNEKHFIIVFKYNTGKSPEEYINEYNLKMKAIKKVFNISSALSKEDNC